MSQYDNLITRRVREEPLMTTKTARDKVVYGPSFIGFPVVVTFYFAVVVVDLIFSYVNFIARTRHWARAELG